MVQLRDYQSQAYARGIKALNQGKKALIVIGTGGGKTHVSGAFVRSAVNSGKKVILVCPLRILIWQHARALIKYFGFHKDEIGILQGDNTDDLNFLLNCRVVIAMAQSLASDRGQEFLRLVKFDVCLQDEKHLRHLDTAELKINAPFNIGLTATPFREKGQDVLDEYEWIAPISTKELILRGQLANFLYHSYSESQLVANGGEDYTEAEQKEVLANITPEFVLREWLKICKPQRYTLGFCGSIEQAKEYAAYFNSQGIISEVCCDETPDSDKRDGTPGFRTITAAFREGKVQVIFSVVKIATGFDEPMAKYALILRPIASLALWFQVFGRVLRIIPTKSLRVLGLDKQPIAHVLDFAGCGLRLPLPTEIDNFEDYIKSQVRRRVREEVVRREQYDRTRESFVDIFRELRGQMVARRDPSLIQDDADLIRELRRQAFWIYFCTPSFVWATYTKVRGVEYPPKSIWQGEGGVLENSIFEASTVENFLMYRQYLNRYKGDRKQPEAWVRDEVRKEFGVQGLVWLRQVSVIENR